ncbi:hypothetical protein HWV62_4607 [Athelia sp. TMB]|nr:hypothetical protein HWV62_4607 [Athelia sp. TMB]
MGIHEVAPSQANSSMAGTPFVLATFLNPLLGDGSLKFSARRNILKFSARRNMFSELDIPLSPINWAAGQLTLRAMNFTAEYNKSVGGLTYWNVPLAPEVIAAKIGGYIQSAAKAYLVQGLLPNASDNGSTAGEPAMNALMLQSVTILQTSADQLFGTIALVASILILAVALLYVGIGDIPLTVSTVEEVLKEKDDLDAQGVQMKIDPTAAHESETDRAEAHEFEIIPLHRLSESDHDSDGDPAEAHEAEIVPPRRIPDSESVRESELDQADARGAETAPLRRLSEPRSTRGAEMDGAATHQADSVPLRRFSDAHEAGTVSLRRLSKLGSVRHADVDEAKTYKAETASLRRPSGSQSVRE